MNKNVGQLDREAFFTAHEDTMYCNFIFPELTGEEIKADTFAYPPCWGILDAGMTMEKHEHAIPEFYVFTQGSGSMTLGEETFAVQAGMSVNIPPNIEHEVSNPASAVQPLIWVSVGLTE